MDDVGEPSNCLLDAGTTYAANVNKVYVFGGFASMNVLNTTQIYDIATNTWTKGAPMPDARTASSAAYYDAYGKIYVIGGFDASVNPTSQTWEYDPVANTWNTARANMPSPLAGGGRSIAGQFIYVQGGYNGSYTNLHYRYDIVGDTWAPMANVPEIIFGPASGAIGENTYLVGGYPFSYATYIYNVPTNSWTTGPYTIFLHRFTSGTAMGIA